MEVRVVHWTKFMLLHLHHHTQKKGTHHHSDSVNGLLGFNLLMSDVIDIFVD